MYSSDRATSFVASDASLLPAMAKRTASQASEAVVKEFPVTPLEDFDPQLFEVKVRGKKKDGTTVVATSYNSQRFTVNLTTGKQWLHVKYQIQASSYDFMKDAASQLETMKVTLAVEDNVASVIRGIEDEVKKAVLEQHKDCKWHSSVQDDLFTAKLVLTAKDPKHLTQCRVRPFQKDVVVAAGKEQVQPLLDSYSGLVRSKVKVVVSLHSVWIMKEGGGSVKAGLTWRIVNLLADVPEQTRYVFPDVFANFSWDDEE